MAGSKKSTKTKDLAPKKSPKGGRLAGNENRTLVREAKPAIKKDLPVKKSGAVKGGRGGRLASNENVTLVRAAN